MRSATRQGGRWIRCTICSFVQFPSDDGAFGMNTQEKIRNKLHDLYEDGSRLKTGSGSAWGSSDDVEHSHECVGWLTAVQNLLHLILGNLQHPYRLRVDSICAEMRDQSAFQVGEVTAILGRLISDLDNDLIFSIESRVRATVFEDFLEEARWYAKAKRICEAGVFAGAVFEDTLRSLSRKCGVKEAGVSTDKLISDLTHKGVLTDVKAKRARASAGIRNKAMHAQWDDIDLNDVNTLISFTEELISILDDN